MELSEEPTDPPLPAWLPPGVGRAATRVQPPIPAIGRVTLPSGQRAWLVAGYEACKRALVHPDLSCNHFHPNYPDLFALRATAGDGGEQIASLSGLDGIEHARHRRRLAGEFSSIAVARQEHNARRIAHGLLDRMASNPDRRACLVGEYAAPFFRHLIIEYLGLPVSCRDSMAELAAALGGAPRGSAAARAASTRFRSALHTVLNDAPTEPPDSVIARLIQRFRADGAGWRSRLLEIIGAMIAATNETGPALAAATIHRLLGESGLARFLRQDPATLHRGLDEMLRLFSVADLAAARIARSDMDLAGIQIRAGDGVVISTGLANHDPTRFSDPERCDPDRNGPAHLAFGYGAHKCLGQHLARLGLLVALEALRDRLPGARLDGDDALDMIKDGAFVKAVALRVRW